MYDDLDTARLHATRATQLNKHDIHIVPEGSGYSLNGDDAPPVETVETVQHVPETLPLAAEATAEDASDGE